MNLKEVCQYFSVSKDTIERWQQFKGMPYSKITGRLLFNKKKIAVWEQQFEIEKAVIKK